MRHIAKLITQARIAMQTTTPKGWLRSRPMGTQRESFDGHLWFFTHASEPKVQEIKRILSRNSLALCHSDEAGSTAAMT